MSEKLNQELLDRLEMFLSGTFHQDVECVDGALTELIEISSAAYLKSLSIVITAFLESSLSKVDKENFIAENADIYFPNIGKSEIQWLSEVNERVKSAALNK